ncbi:hypothetical protein VCHA50P415_70154 [Vibrio chagasii]|nr:hypothetical protein VCHA34P121_10564 [Vibrio chagasii]CAH6863587.1 hypothetical protein VCHA34P131_20081 [Vibrio chagasii]CAH6908718.1 hypothetical protein VCHA35P150_20511 [Vibrio chagasii]CAH6920482.1 hypothetical protein VCHA36O163_30316 [Vibrio chagasii]CAH7035330.1 hypothetical protein VCHA31O71_60156 [Vibrio chagasii]
MMFSVDVASDAYIDGGHIVSLLFKQPIRPNYYEDQRCIILMCGRQNITWV